MTNTNTNTNTNTTTKGERTLEQAGLGRAPFRFVGMTESLFQAAPGEPVKAGSSCDYCATPIKNCFWIESADGVRSKLGCDCIVKAAPGTPVAKAATEAEKRRAREKRHAREAEKASELAAILADEAVRVALAAHPHVTPYLAAQGNTFLDYADWVMQYAGTSGRVRLLGEIRARLR